MRKKAIGIFAMLLCLTLPLAACAGTATTDEDNKNTSVSTANSAEPTKGTSGSQNPAGAASFDTSAFSGKVTSCYYAGDGKLLVLADQLNLYDAYSGTVLAAADVALRDMKIHSFHDGYLVTGIKDDSVVGYLYSADLSLQKEISFDGLLSGDFILGSSGIAISEDGKTLAMAGFRNLYLYDLSAGKLTTLLAIDKTAASGNIKVTALEQIAFAGESGGILFAGKGNSAGGSDGEDSFSIYGTVSLDGGKIRITRPASYTIDGFYAGERYLLMEQAFARNDGTLLTVEIGTFQEHKLSFSSTDEGRDGVFASERGDYFATAVLGSGLTVRIYDTQSGSLLHTETITNADGAYVQRAPKVVILDDAKTCMVLLGSGQEEVDTVAETFQFGE